MARGGYQIIDLKNIPLVANPASPTDATHIEGIYEAIKATRKPIMFTNVAIDTDDGIIELRDFITSPIEISTRYEFFDPALEWVFRVLSIGVIDVSKANLTAKLSIDEPLKLGIGQKGYVLYLDTDDTLAVNELTGKLGVTSEDSDPET